MGLVDDVRLRFRFLYRNPQLALPVLLFLTLGIAGNTLVFSVVHTVLLRPLPYADPEKLVMVWDVDADPDTEPTNLTVLNYAARKKENRVFDDIGALAARSFSLTGLEEPIKVQGAAVTAEMVPMLVGQLQAGRPISDEEDLPGGENVALISHEFWRAHWGEGVKAVGESLSLDGASYTIVGILPPRFKLPFANTDVIVPLGLDLSDTSLAQRRRHYLICIGRLKDGVTAAQAEQDLQSISRRLAADFPDTNKEWGSRVIPMREVFVADLRLRLVVLQIAAVFMLLIVCANVTHLLMIKALQRSGEMAMRIALGGGRARLVRQFFIEGLLLVIPGGILGLLVAHFSLKPLVSLSYINQLSLFVDAVRIDPQVIGFSVLMTLLAALPCTLIPWLSGSDLKLAESLKEGGRSLSGARSHRLINTIVTGEIAIAVVLLIGAGLMVKSFQRLQEVDPGFRSGNVLAMQLTLPEARYNEDHLRRAFVERSLERIASLPEVESAAVSTMIPMRGIPRYGTLNLEGRDASSASNVLFERLSLVSPDYFETLNLPLTEGRYFNEQDHAEAPGTAIVSEAMARKYWPDESPIGKRFQRGPRHDPEQPWMSVVGVVGDVHYFKLSTDTEPAYYLPYTQRAAAVQATQLELIVHITQNTSGLVRRVQKAVWSVDRDVPLSQIEDLDKVVSSSISDSRFTTLLIALFTVLALGLALAGVYSVIIQFVQQRYHELGIRVALGARSADIVKLILRNGSILTVLGLVIGLAGAIALTRFLSNQLYQISPLDPVTFVLAALFLCAAAMTTFLLAARRAVRVDPCVTLKFE